MRWSHRRTGGTYRSVCVWKWTFIHTRCGMWHSTHFPRTASGMRGWSLHSAGLWHFAHEFPAAARSVGAWGLCGSWHVAHVISLLVKHLLCVRYFTWLAT